MQTKQCSKCLQVKPADAFGKRSDCVGLVSACRECERARGRKFAADKRASLEGKFEGQRGNAERRGIPFLLTFDQWLSIWTESGKLAERGRGSEKYCMSRIGDCGAYEVGNVFIQSGRNNISDGNMGKHMSQETRDKISKAHTGTSHSWSAGQNNPMHRPEVKAKISEAIGGLKHYKQRGVNTPEGFFATAKSASEATGVKKVTIEWRARHHKFGYSYGPLKE